ncbi:signal peptidase I [Robertkochia marina]|uniref:Signal peptidase I n=1 Tax=Robertkochia marina TaxID=1227945 RepID=A0A4S3M0Q3_9FLAO|nr:signal peptidase I [Robertkochia marina]THD66587.1 signal peptidase I [Robertkochia marina]TRZ45574.1 signal peptidase I [Robertkochia marina]
MTAIQWLIVFFLIQVIHFLGTWKLYKKAGRQAWEAIIPVYNAVVLMKIIRRPWWWVILLFLPIINLIMIPVVWVETIRSFGRNSSADTLLVLATLGFYIYYVNYSLDVNYIEDRSLQPRTALGEWVSSILFAVVAATLVHTYFIQPYVIPTSSLEQTLLVGDFLFVSKFHYGARTPMTTVAFPMVHDTLPVAKTKSYLKKPQLPYFRLPGFQDVKRNDIVVFSWPADTVEQFFVKTNKRIRKPIDKKSNYVKRCVAIAGDTLEIRDGFVYINGEKTNLPDRAKTQYSYRVTSSKGVTSKALMDAGARELNRIYIAENLNQQQLNAVYPYLVTQPERDQQGGWYLQTGKNGIPIDVVRNFRLGLKEIANFQREATLTLEGAEKLRATPGIDSVIRYVMPKEVVSESFFPNDAAYTWNLDNMGPIYMPEKGKTIKLTTQNLPLYKKIIREYEGNTLDVQGSQVIINGEVTDSYTFNQDYYWMMGDNRHRSEDSRYWGFVPYDHIVGKPVFIWFSIENFTQGFKNWEVRWDRVFTTVGGEGKPQSYLIYFLGALAIYFGWSQFNKRKKQKTT